MKTLEDFIKKNKPKKRKSKLEIHKKEILELYAQDYTVEQIQDFLLKNRIKITISNIYKFLQKHKNIKSIYTSSSQAQPSLKAAIQNVQEPQEDPFAKIKKDFANKPLAERFGKAGKKQLEEMGINLD